MAVIKVVSAAQGIAMTEGISKKPGEGDNCPRADVDDLAIEFFLLGPDLTRYQR